MASYPDYVYKTLIHARHIGQWYCGQADAAALCFDVLALFPDCVEASELIYQLFCDEWTIYDNRVAIQRMIDEWDDRPWQHRRRLALSFRFMSRWLGWQREYEPAFETQQDGPPDVAEILKDGKMELLSVYCLGDDECSGYAWAIFADALKKTSDQHTCLLWIGKTYADLGFFADSADVLGELCSRFNDFDTRRLLAEVLWWRDNAHRIPWIPPQGNGLRYQCMIQRIDPSAPKVEDEIHRVRSENQNKRITPYRPTLDPELANLFNTSIPIMKETHINHIVDWHFLDQDNTQPGEVANWVQDEIEMFDDSPEMVEELRRIHRWTRNIPPPSTPPRYDPDEPPFKL